MLSANPLFLSDNALKCFAKQIVCILYTHTSSQPSQHSNEYIVYCKTWTDGALQIASDMDVLLGFTTDSLHPVEFTICVANVDVATKKVQKGEFVSALDMGQCIPLTSLENYKISLHTFPKSSPIICFIGRCRSVLQRIHIKDCNWKYISFERKFFLAKCNDLQIQHITHIRDFEHIPYLPNIQSHVDACIEDWKKQRCQQMVDTILKDLMEKTWHPSRHIDWCLDNDEKEGLMGG